MGYGFVSKTNIVRTHMLPNVGLGSALLAISGPPARRHAKAAMAKSKAKSEAKGKAKGKAKATKKAMKADEDESRNSRGSAIDFWLKNYDGKTGMNANQAVAVKDHLKSLKAQGDATPLEVYEKSNRQEKRNIAMRLHIDKSASWLTATEEHSRKAETVGTTKKGWMTLWEIAVLEHLPFVEATKDVLMDLVDDCEVKFHENEKLAKKGHKQYWYEKKLAKTETDTKKKEVTAKTMADVADVKEFDEITDKISSKGNRESSSAEEGIPKRRKILPKKKPEPKAWADMTTDEKNST